MAGRLTTVREMELVIDVREPDLGLTHLERPTDELVTHRHTKKSWTGKEKIIFLTQYVNVLHSCSHLVAVVTRWFERISVDKNRAPVQEMICWASGTTQTHRRC